MTDDDSRTLILDTDNDDLQELSEYLDVLSSSTRLKILKAIERSPKDVRQISAAIETSYENTKKHLDKLMSIGVVRKEAGLSRPTAKGVHPVWKYSLVPGGLEAITRSLGLFANLKLTLTDAVLAKKLAAVRETFSGGSSPGSPRSSSSSGGRGGRQGLCARRGEHRRRPGRTRERPNGGPERRSSVG
ncbi:winged helix-turn-helix domain-containing protein, partial [Methanoculleus chikugoensis]|uniref:ArsR/SmtB family transcription factor n=1 Tax=Methanoculleus chikugoensis TaxID=118126 RepID=UPI001FB236F6